MKSVGLDFDNTIVIYDDLFKKLAIEKGLINNDSEVAWSKTKIRDHLRRKNQDHEFTLLQGEVYGSRILEAEPAVNLIKTITKLKSKGAQFKIISHKTRTPYSGPSYDLRKSALEWLKKYKIADKENALIGLDHVYFEDTKEAKIARINAMDLDYYVDDLPEIVNNINKPCSGILYSTNPIHAGKGMKIMSDWNQLDTLTSI